MLQIDRVTALAHQAAELLPAPPCEGDIDGYLSWRELVWSTATRLGEIAGPALASAPGGVAGAVAVPGAKVSAQELLELARIAGPRWSADSTAGLRSGRVCGARRVRRTVGTRRS